MIWYIYTRTCIYVCIYMYTCQPFLTNKPYSTVLVRGKRPARSGVHTCIHSHLFSLTLLLTHTYICYSVISTNNRTLMFHHVRALWSNSVLTSHVRGCKRIYIYFRIILWSLSARELAYMYTYIYIYNIYKCIRKYLRLSYDFPLLESWHMYICTCVYIQYVNMY